MRLLPVICAAVFAAACSSSSVPAGGDAGIGVVSDAALGVDARVTGCDPVTQSGCADGEKCTVVGSGTERVVGCALIAGSREPGDSCDTSAGDGDDCAPGLYCDSSSAPATCVEFCVNEPADSCGAQSVCALGFTVGESDVRICTDVCDPVDQDCERNEFGCYPSRSGPSCAQIGGGSTPVGEGASCGFANECNAGLACLFVSESWSCFKLCDPFAIFDDGCSETQLCNQVDDNSWGICINE